MPKNMICWIAYLPVRMLIRHLFLTKQPLILANGVIQVTVLFWMILKRCVTEKLLIQFVNTKDIQSFLQNKTLPRFVRGFAFVSTKAVLVRKSRRTFGAHKPKAPLCKGSWRRRRLRDCFSVKFCFFLQSLRLASQSTSLCTREALYRPTVHLKSVTHYTLHGKECEKEYEQKCPYSFLP